ncbi:Hypothetical predicted protein [Mytilus galloprovincialis]|uniref:Uncharacterized protein n=1 Tax=Mytilus galloprovincialis TaxID=29158 RepID=A0A8B6D377_MYTGA|nr:Hypothetical predicted protein [Mytilus galloprovincialis]
MRWHPMLIRWCLSMRSKSAKAYDSMRDSGFIKLQRTRTLFDYLHYTNSALGFQPDVMKMLQDEASKLANKFRNSIFFEEVSEELILTGDLNFYLYDPTDNDAHKFLETPGVHGFSQHVYGAYPRCSHNKRKQLNFE